MKNKSLYVILLVCFSYATGKANRCEEKRIKPTTEKTTTDELILSPMMGVLNKF